MRCVCSPGSQVGEVTQVGDTLILPVGLCIHPVSPSTNELCMTELGQELMAHNYSCSVLQKAVSVAWPAETMATHKHQPWPTCLGSQCLTFIYNKKCIYLNFDVCFSHSVRSYSVFSLCWRPQGTDSEGGKGEAKEGLGWKGQTDVSVWSQWGTFFPTGCLLWSGLMWC